MAEAYLNLVLEHAKSVAISLDEIRENTKQDTTLIALINLIKSNTWHLLDKQNKKFTGCNLHELKIYRRIAHELTVTADASMILRRNRIVVPSTLRKRMASLAHENHLGITKTKSLLLIRSIF